MGADRPCNVLFLCTHNSARSILAEGIVTLLGAGRFVGHSAGSRPSGRVNPFALEVLKALGCDTGGMHSKSWDAFAGPHAPMMDFIITVCDNAAGESCPVWPGEPLKLHWGLADPSTVGSDDAGRRAAFQDTARQIAARVGAFIDRHGAAGEGGDAKRHAAIFTPAGQ
ncbi:arsenate reductase ArsC [Lysobacter sp. D1-1-M9]|uniref:arsenate reductase ArsC n=1 Tax=Novilysobacter longmucuonensis TaxID=3098603 RepID=UPI002FCA9F7F